MEFFGEGDKGSKVAELDSWIHMPIVSMRMIYSIGHIGLAPIV
jgi:hypothetical protein